MRKRVTVSFGIDNSITFLTDVETIGEVLNTVQARTLGYNPSNVNAIIGGQVCCMSSTFLNNDIIVVEAKADSKGC